MIKIRADQYKVFIEGYFALQVGLNVEIVDDNFNEMLTISHDSGDKVLLDNIDIAIVDEQIYVQYADHYLGVVHLCRPNGEIIPKISNVINGHTCYTFEFINGYLCKIPSMIIMLTDMSRIESKNILEKYLLINELLIKDLANIIIFTMLEKIRLDFDQYILIIH